MRRRPAPWAAHALIALATLLASADAAPARADLVPRLSVSETLVPPPPILLSPGNLSLSLPGARLLLNPTYPPLDLGLRTLRLVSGQNQHRVSPYIGTGEHNLGGLRIRF
jgi:hypothetical protein